MRRRFFGAALRVFIIERGRGQRLGPWRAGTVDTPSKLSILVCFGHGLTRASDVYYEVEGSCGRGVKLPPLRYPRWGEGVPDGARLDEDQAFTQLQAGRPVQVFVFNADADLAACYLILPVP